MSETPALSSEREIYRRAPVIEAVVDIRSTPRRNFTVGDVSALAETLLPEFTWEAEAIEREIEFSADGTKKMTERPVGLMLRGQSDRSSVVQLQTGGFACSRLAPYERWEPFRDEARRLWTMYAQAAVPEVVTRVGVRYVNVIEVGDVIEDIRPFLNIYPVTPWRLQTAQSGFSLQIRHPLENNVQLLINESTTRHSETKHFAVLLDLEASVQRDIATNADAVWNAVEELHVIVEKVFESAITDRVRELIR